jgi:hypothetical protein
MCQDCLGAGGAGLCRLCEARVGTGAFPFDRQHYSLDGLFGHAFALWKRYWLQLGAAFAALLVAIYALAMLGSLLAGRSGHAVSSFAALGPRFWALQVVQVLVQVGLELPVFGLCLDVAEGKPPEFAAAVRRIRRLPVALLQTALIYVPIALYAALVAGLAYGVMRVSPAGSAAFAWVVGVGGLLGVGLGVYFGLGVVFAVAQIVHDERCGALESLRVSFRLVAGQRWNVLGISLVAWLVAVSGLLACCVGTLATLPLATLLYCSLFLALNSDRASPTAD